MIPAASAGLRARTMGALTPGLKACSTTPTVFT